MRILTNNINIIISFVFLSWVIAPNKYSWLLLFDADGIFRLTDGIMIFGERLLFIILDLLLIASSILFYRYRQQNNFLLSYLKLLSINSIILTTALVALELIFGNWFNTNEIYKLNIIRDRVINYNLNNLYLWKSNNIIYSRDKWGFRGNYNSVDNIDILTIGGSTTDQRYISDGFTFQDILQKEFKKNGKDVFVVNAGIDGQSTFGHIKNFDWWFPHIPNLRVNYFLFFIGVNDFHIDEFFSYDDLRAESSNVIKSVIKSKSALYYLYRTIEGIQIAGTFGLKHDPSHSFNKLSTVDFLNQPNLSNYEEIMSNRLDAYEQRLNILCEKVKSFGSIPIFVSQSQRRVYDFIDQHLYGQTSVVQNYEGHLVNGVDYYYMIQLLHKRTKKVSDKNGGIFINLDQELKFDIENDFYDSNHSTPSGAKKIGEYLYKNLKHRF